MFSFLTNMKDFCFLQLTINENDLLGNILNILKWNAKRMFQRLRKPVDTRKWVTGPATINAFYNPNRNDIGNAESRS